MDVRQEYLDKARAELGDLAQAGVIMTGNAFCHVLLVKGEPEVPAATAGSGCSRDRTARPCTRRWAPWATRPRIGAACP